MIYFRVVYISRILLFVLTFTVNLNAQPPSSGLVAYFNFDNLEDDNLVSVSGTSEGVQGSLVGAKLTSDAIYGSNALEIDPTDGESFVSFSKENSSPFTFSKGNKMSIALWIKPKRINSNEEQRFISVNSGHGGITYYFEISKNNEFNAFISTKDYSNDSFGSAYARGTSYGSVLSSNDIDTWRHIAFTFDGKFMKLYLDANLVKEEVVSTPNNKIVDFTNALHLGAMYKKSLDVTSNQFHGNIDELYFYNRALSLNEINEIMTLAFGNNVNSNISKPNNIQGSTKISAQDSDSEITLTSSSKNTLSINAINDEIIPASSSDYRVPRYTFMPKKGTKEWIVYDFQDKIDLENLGIYWFDEAQAGPICLPKSWKVYYLNKKKWKEAKIENDYGVERDGFNYIKFTKKISTKKIKIEVQLHENVSAGVYEIELNSELKINIPPISTDPDNELLRLKEQALLTLSKDIDEFNGYSHLNGNRPEFDGWLNKENNKRFLIYNSPKFLCSNEDFTEVFNYRWWMISKRLKQWSEKGKDYYVFTEFPGFPGWASTSGAIPAPAGHQFYDLRWMRNPEYLQSYAEYWFSGPPSYEMQVQNNTWLSTLPRPQSHHYTSWMIDATEALLKVHPDGKWRDSLLPFMEKHQSVWDKIFKVNAEGTYSHGLYKCLDMYDANEFTISTTLGLIASKGSYDGYNTIINKKEPYKGQERWRRYFTDGDGWRAAYREGIKNYPDKSPQEFSLENYSTVPQAFGGNHLDLSYPNLYTIRPSLNSYMYANLKSLGVLYDQKANENNNKEDKIKSYKYSNLAKQLSEKIIKSLWHTPSLSDEFQFYSNKGKIEDPFFYSRLSADNLHTGGVVDKLSIIRESVGYTPWYFNMLPSENSEFDIAWKQFGDEMGFKNKFGMTTAEFRHDYFNEMSYGWNGRGWPFQNSVVYKSFANYLTNYKKSRSGINDQDRELLYFHMNQYVELHGRRRSIGEWYLPIKGGYRMPGGGDVIQSQPAQGKGFGDVQDYFHSTYPDMLIEDLIGFKASHDNNFSIESLLPQEKWEFFYLGDLRYHGHDIDIIWKKDWDLDLDGNQGKLCVWVDGKLVAQSESLNSKIIIDLPND